MISNERLTKALTYLAETDEECARRLGYYRGLEDQTKTQYAMCFMESQAETVKERGEMAYCNTKYRDHLEKINEARMMYETMRLKRKTEETIIEVWRSMNANRRVGNV